MTIQPFPSAHQNELSFRAKARNPSFHKPCRRNSSHNERQIILRNGYPAGACPPRRRGAGYDIVFVESILSEIHADTISTLAPESDSSAIPTLLSPPEKTPDQVRGGVLS